MFEILTSPKKSQIDQFSEFFIISDPHKPRIHFLLPFCERIFRRSRRITQTSVKPGI